MGDDVPLETRLVRCALDLIAEHGLAATTLNMIAAELGVTRAAVYYHFRTKEELVRAVAAPVTASFADLAARADALPERDRPRFLVDSLARHAVQHRRVNAAIYGDVSAVQYRDEAAAGPTLFDRVRDALAGPGAGGPARRRHVHLHPAGAPGRPGCRRPQRRRPGACRRADRRPAAPDRPGGLTGTPATGRPAAAGPAPAGPPRAPPRPAPSA